MVRAVYENYVLTEEGEIIDTDTGEVLSQLRHYKAIPYSQDNYSTAHLGTFYLSDHIGIDRTNYKILEKILDREPVLTPTKGNLSDTMRFLWTQPVYRVNVLTGLKRAMAKPSYHEHQSIASTEMWTRQDYRAKQMAIRSDPDWRRELGRAIKLGQNSLEGKKNLSDGQIRRFSDPKERKKASAVALKKFEERPELRESLSDTITELWKDPEYRARTLLGMEKRSTPEFADKIRNSMTHEERSLAAKRAWVTRRENQKCLKS